MEGTGLGVAGGCSTAKETARSGQTEPVTGSGEAGSDDPAHGRGHAVIWRTIPRSLVMPGRFLRRCRALGLKHAGPELILPAFGVRGGPLGFRRPPVLALLHTPLGTGSPITSIARHRRWQSKGRGRGGGKRGLQEGWGGLMQQPPREVGALGAATE